MFLRKQKGVCFNFLLLYNYYESLKLLNLTTVGSCDHMAMYISHQMLFQKEENCVKRMKL
jgi:hypothetical protein